MDGPLPGVNPRFAPVYKADVTVMTRRLNRGPDTRDFTTVNNVKANGGSMSNSGPAIAGGMLFVNSGYSHHGGILPGNVLLAFSPE